MKNGLLECVVVCDGYADRLVETLPYTRRHVDRLVVVTGDEDKETQELCRQYDVRCIPTWVHKRTPGSDGKPQIDKAQAINHGLAHLACDGWLLQLDADIVLPDRFSDWMAEHPMDEGCIYGVDRWDVLGCEAWDKLRVHDWMHDRREYGFMIHPPHEIEGITMSSRVGHGGYGGWCPIGFFQAWFGKKIKRYPWKPNSDAEHTDVLHAAQWPPENRRLISDLFVLHLVSSLEMGIDWRGRKSPPFRPAKHHPKPHEHHRKHHHHHPKPYGEK